MRLNEMTTLASIGQMPAMPIGEIRSWKVLPKSSRNKFRPKNKSKRYKVVK